MSSPQCGTPELTLKHSHCLQTESEIVKTLQKFYPKFQKIFISTDGDGYFESIEKIGFKIFQTKKFLSKNFDEKRIPLVDLAVHGKSEIFIANCVSSFSAFAVRQRTVTKRVTMFWGVENFNNLHTEL